MSEEKMDIIPSYECMNACIVNHLNQAGIRVSGSDLYFAGCGYPIHYRKGSLTRIASEGFDANFRFLDQYKLPYEFGRMPPGKETLLGLLAESRAITIRTVSDFLTYDPVYSQTSGASHFINLLEYDKRRKKFLIVDGDVPSAQTGCYSGWVDETDLICGWTIQSGEVLRLQIPEDLNPADFSRRVREEADRQVTNAVHHYLNGRSPLFSSQVTGEQACICMLKDLEKYVEKGEYRELTRDANFRLRIDGYMGAKKFLLEKFKEQNRSKLAETYEKIIEDWSRWHMLLLKSGLVPTKKNFEHVRNRMEELVRQEHSILESY